jgi:hypothetical protein
MAGSYSSVHGGNHGDDEPPVSRAEMRNMANSLVEAMERMLDECLPAARRRAPHHRDESSDENSGFERGFRDHFQGGRDDHGGGRRAGHENRCAGGDRDHDRRVRFDDEDESTGSHKEEYDDDDDENPFAHCGPFERHRQQHRAAGHDGDNHHGHNGADPDSIALKLSVPKFLGKEDADAYLDWEEQYDQIFRVHNLSDQIHVSLASVEFYGYALTWWNQIQENQLVLGRDHINIWAEMKHVMRRRFIPSSYRRDLHNWLQTLKQGSKSVDEYFKDMELLLIRSDIREDEGSRMARFLHGLNDAISSFVEMFPYQTLQDLVDQAMRTEKKIQQEGRGRSYGGRSVSTSWRRQQPGTFVGGVRSQGATARSSPSIGTATTSFSSASSPANQQENRCPATSSAAPSTTSAAASSSHSRGIVCHKCQGCGHIAAECPSKRTMLVNDQGEWESESDEDDAPIYDEEIGNDETEIQPDEGGNNCFISQRVLSVTAVKEENN